MTTQRQEISSNGKLPQPRQRRLVHLGTALLILALISLSGCALQPIHPEQISARVDPISIRNAAEYHADLDECAHYANHSLQHARNAAVGNALIGALVGAAIGQAIGGGRRWAHTPALRNTGAAYGALAGSSEAVAYGANRADTIVLNCMLHRGYALLY